MSGSVRQPSETEFAEPAFMADPYPTYTCLRDESPVFRIKLPSGLPAWFISRYEDARAALADPRLGKGNVRIGHQNKFPFGDVPMHEHLLHADPPKHTRLRKLVARAFVPARVEGLRPRIHQIAGELLDAISDRHTVDLIESFAFPLPLAVISELLGISPDQRSEFQRMAIDLVSSPPDTTAEQIREQAVRFERYLRALVAEKRHRPADDLLSALAGSTDADEGSLTETELVSMAFLLLLAGYETTVNLIGNGVYSLLRHPDQLAALRARPELIEPAVEEMLRFESPLAFATLRQATEPVTYGGVTIPAGELVVVGLSAANRDGRHFHDPDGFDVSRDTAGHLAFGHGIHFCLGATLGRMEGQIAIGELLRRYSSIELDADPADLRWRAGMLIRGLRELPVRLSRADGVG
ncbi:cytochrome P450 [Spirillospora sp. NPDC047279]|uniref:cytochrome P450 family protein n=1 Tax=Spirillospora sp. NPDC047279 TaxID=3155478 RepID=UPI0033CFCFB1